MDDLKIAVSEACTNSVLSNEAAGAGAAPVTVSFERLPDGLVVEVRDRGLAYEPRSPETTVADGADELGDDRFAMSMALLASLVDRCEARSRPGGGMTTRLSIARPR